MVTHNTRTMFLPDQEDRLPFVQVWTLAFNFDICSLRKVLLSTPCPILPILNLNLLNLRELIRYLFLVEPIPKIKAKIQTWTKGRLVSFRLCKILKDSVLSLCYLEIYICYSIFHYILLLFRFSGYNEERIQK